MGLKWDTAFSGRETAQRPKKVIAGRRDPNNTRGPAGTGNRDAKVAVGEDGDEGGGGVKEGNFPGGTVR